MIAKHNFKRYNKNNTNLNKNMVNINAIRTIEDAKNAKYNNDRELLIDEEKEIFDNSLLTSDNMDEIRNTASLLDNVKETKTVFQSKNSGRALELYPSMISAKENKTIPYELINGSNGRVDEAIRIL